MLAALVFAAAVGTAAPQPLPREVQAFINRRTGCNHWGGEEPYDAARRREIARAVRSLRCDRLEADERALRRRHGKSSAVLKALVDTRDDY